MKKLLELIRLIIAFGPEKIVEMIHSSQYDSLTGLYRREKVIEETKKEISRSERTDAPFCFVFIDLDNFGPINKERGHDKGDEVLKDFAFLMQKELRKSDMVARWGGDEFALLLNETDEAGAYQLLKRIYQKSQEMAIPISFCYGISQHKQGDSFESISTRADHKMLYYKREKARV